MWHFRSQKNINKHKRYLLMRVKVKNRIFATRANENFKIEIRIILFLYK